MKSLKFNDCSEMSLSHDLTIKPTTCSSRDSIFMNSVVPTIKELSVCKPMIVVILSLNNRQMSNVDGVIFNFFT